MSTYIEQTLRKDISHLPSVLLQYSKRRPNLLQYFLYILLVINLITFVLYGIDKWKAIHHKWRIPEHTLLGFAAAFGSAGALLGMLFFHHKTQKPKFRFSVPVMLVIQAIIIMLVMKYLGFAPSTGS